MKQVKKINFSLVTSTSLSDFENVSAPLDNNLILYNKSDPLGEIGSLSKRGTNSSSIEYQNERKTVLNIHNIILISFSKWLLLQ